MDYSKLYAPFTGDLLKLVETVIKAATEIVHGPDFDALMPTAHVLQNDGDLALYGFPGDLNPETKPMVGGVLRKLTRENQAVVFVVEAWISSYDAKTRPALDAAARSGKDFFVLPPRVDLNRKEVVMLQVFVKERTILIMAPMIRDGKTVRLGEWAVMSDSANPAHELKPASFE